jgi:hypothetical protein
VKQIATYLYRTRPARKLTIKQVLLDSKPGLEVTIEAGGKSETRCLLLPSPQPPTPWNLGTKIVFVYKPKTIEDNPDPTTWQDFYAWNAAMCRAMGNEPPEPPTEITESEVKQS